MELRWFYLYRIYLHQKEKIIYIILLCPTKSATLPCKQFRCISHSKALCKMKPLFTTIVYNYSSSSSSLISGSSNPHSVHTSFSSFPSFSFSPSISSSLFGHSAVTLFWKNSVVLKLLRLLTVTLFRLLERLC